MKKAPHAHAFQPLTKWHSSVTLKTELITKEVFMPTKNPRVNITFEPSTITLLSSLAKHEHKSLSSLAKQLILEALERREDMVLSAIAKTRETAHSKTVKHEDAWE